MDTSRFPRGTVLLCYFPYDDAPDRPGPDPHYCMVVDEFQHNGKEYVAVCYGTSSFSESLFAKHDSRVLTVGRQFISGIDMPKDRGNFVADRVAILPVTDQWIVPTVRGRLEFLRRAKRESDVQHARLYAEYMKLEKVMIHAMTIAAKSFSVTGKVGLPVKDSDR
ncbi:hypothetical protein HHL24_26980 [Paraburkholderia sp. RP-4-7]|uniref:Uncharacterized protein n=1 Tax=Paraburkholderia polaris TaxID=2728848 RepID=A0A848IN03_9BURK|nr:hypothetical protein [Paraburkholderia polaris]NMM01569.1 hypothetical protein [Paraburkholderia polaris]